jgi:hypothetical protein
MGYFKTMEIEKMENERLQRDQDQEPTMGDGEMRMLARKFLVAMAEAHLSEEVDKKNGCLPSGKDQLFLSWPVSAFKSFSQKDWETFKRFVQFAL